MTETPGIEMIEAREYVFIKRKIFNLTGVDLSCYKTPQVQRRLKTYLIRSGYTDWHRFFRDIQNDSLAVSNLKDYLTINVSSFFRDTEKFDYLRDTILPELLHGHRKLRIWSAGCSKGHEPYSLAMMLSEATGLYRQHYILATDIDRSALNHTEAGGPYTEEEVSKLPPSFLERYFRLADDGYYVIDKLPRRLTIRYQNLLSDPFEDNFDLIVCRNVVIYFTTEVKERLYRRFHQSLRQGGILFVGGTEVIPRVTDVGFETAGISFYRRNA